jgi:hypothetical protein
MSRNSTKLKLPPSEALLTIAALNRNSAAVHRLRRALCGLDLEDRLTIAERLSAMNAPRGRRRVTERR